MSKFFVILFSVLSLLTASISNACQKPILNKITYQVSAEKWAQTSTAQVFINIDATLDNSNLTDINNQMLQNLKKIANADWHITQLNHTQDKTGLEQLHVEAEARVAENQLANLRSQAKTISKPGTTYAITNIAFNPSMAEIQQTRADVRAQIYAQVKAEVVRLNQQFTDQHYFVNGIDFAPVPGPMIVPSRLMTTMSVAGNTSTIPVSAHVVETAMVTIASMPSPSIAR